MIVNLIEHENSIKLWENSTNGITKQCSMNQTQRSTRDHIVKDEKVQLTKGRSRELSKQLQEFASIQPKESIAQAWM